jgi:class 3 adenylate cyclase/tetratricopeptide (TPR) repeat protein
MILTSKSALEGERKQVTVLFADLKGSMELLADRDPEEARKIIDPVLDRMMEAVHRYEGTVNQVLGDGIMALFGAPVAHEDHAVRASYAALRMQDAIKRYAASVEHTAGVPLQIRVGLNSGEVVVRSIGSDLHMDYSAIGQTTHLAARMEQLARAGSILTTADTLRLAEGYIQVKSLGRVPVKGLPESVAVFEITGAGPARTRLQAAAARGLTRFVGRKAEIEQLRRVLSLARGGHGQVVAIIGEAGVGKSRLVYEFTHSDCVQNWLVLEAASVPYGKATSYLPVIDLLKNYFKIADRDTHAEMRDKVVGRILGLDRALESLLTPLIALLDMPVDDASWPTLDPAQRRQRTLDAAKRLLLRESQVQPVLVVFEDLHWVDTESQAVLDGLVQSFTSTCPLLLATYRPEYEHRWASKTYYSQLRLDSLPGESTGEFLQDLLGRDRHLEPLKQMLVERGNPFFLEETVRTLVETKALVGERGAYHLARPVESLHVPTTVQTILAARIDRLPPDEKWLLQTASVIGKDVPYTVLAAISDQAEAALRRGLSHLQATEFLYETRLFPDLEYTFKHALTHEVAYGSLLQERRRLAHARICQAIERLFADRLVEHIEALARHAFRGEVWDKAVLYLRQAGQKAAGRSANREAVGWFERGLLALEHLPQERGTIEQAIDLRIDLRNSLLPLGEIARMHDDVREAGALADRLGDERRRSLTSSLMALTRFFMGDSEGALESARLARVIATTLGDTSLEVPATNYLGYALYGLGDYREAVTALRRNVTTLQGESVRERFGLAVPPSVLARAYLAFCLSELGEFQEAIRFGEEGVRLANLLDDPYTTVMACWGVGHLYVRKGDLDLAIPLIQRGLAACRDWTIRAHHPHTAALLGYAHALGGRPTEAVVSLKEALEESPRGQLLLDSLHLLWLGEAYLIAGRADEALEFAHQGLDAARHRKERGHQAWGLRLLGKIASLERPPKVGDAEARYLETIALANELGMRPLIAHCHLGLGELYRRSGDHDQAYGHLTSARTMYREMEMRFWLVHAEGAMRRPA